MKTLLYRMDCLTNMHVGSGDVNYSIVDNEIEKDPILKNIAVIHSSGIKGALKDYFEHSGYDKDMISYIFGNEIVTENPKERRTLPGNYKFFGATLMAKPLRVSDGTVSYVLTTSDELITQQVKLFNDLSIEDIKGNSIENFSVKVDENDILVSHPGEINEVEGIPVKPFDISNAYEVIEALIAPSFAIGDANFFGNQDYPFMVRNCLDENGISKNLWYEEVLPHESVLYFAVMADVKYINEFKKAMENVIQFGGNASIGYGFAKLQCVAESR